MPRKSPIPTTNKGDGNRHHHIAGFHGNRHQPLHRVADILVNKSESDHMAALLFLFVDSYAISRLVSLIWDALTEISEFREPVYPSKS